MHTTTSTFNHNDDWRKLALQMSTSNRMAVTKNANDANDTYWLPPERDMLTANKPIAPSVYLMKEIYQKTHKHTHRVRKQILEEEKKKEFEMLEMFSLNFTIRLWQWMNLQQKKNTRENKSHLLKKLMELEMCWLTKQLILYFPGVVLRYPVSNSMIEPILLYACYEHGISFTRTKTQKNTTTISNRSFSSGLALFFTLLWKSGQMNGLKLYREDEQKKTNDQISWDINAIEFFALTL